MTDRKRENKFILYTDIVGHTKMFGRVGPRFRRMRERHDELFRLALAQHAKSPVVKGTGDGYYVAFDEVASAIETAVAFRHSLVIEDWAQYLPPELAKEENRIRVRLGLHSGLVTVFYNEGRADDFEGLPRTVAEKVMSLAVGNQILLTRPVRDEAKVNLSRRDEFDWKRFREYRLRDVPDTVEVWSLAELEGKGELSSGPEPVQPPEHRTILFGIISDCSNVQQKLGPRFERLKDKWDDTWTAAISAHAPDAFVKRLPDGTLAAFSNAVQAVRAAAEFRRRWKIRMRDDAVGDRTSLEAGALATSTLHAVAVFDPRIALESGLVTFEYQSNRPTDVRDQPVNIAAKVCKAGLAEPWKLIISRPVREDAYANMAERDEFQWVCLGGKPVPGEPDPIELWEFQDVQLKQGARSVVWIDAKSVKDGSRLLPAVWDTFARRLKELVDGAKAARPEKDPWQIAHEAGYALAFKDPLEAIQCAKELMDSAKAEPWETSLLGRFKRGSRSDPLVRISVTSGAAKLLIEDGQIKDLKGVAPDSARSIVTAAKNGQVLVAPDLKTVVSTALPPEVSWRRVALPPSAGLAHTEAFEMVEGKLRSPLVWAGTSAAAVALLAFGAWMLMPPSGPALKVGELPPSMNAQLVGLESDADLKDVIAHFRGILVAHAKAEFRSTDQRAAYEASVKPVDEQLRALNTGRARYESAALKQWADEALKANDFAGVKSSLEMLAEFRRPDQGADPRDRLPLPQMLDSFQNRLTQAPDSPDRDRLKSQIPGIKAQVEKLRATPWNVRSDAALTASVNEFLGPYGKFSSEATAIFATLPPPADFPAEAKELLDALKPMQGMAVAAGERGLALAIDQVVRAEAEREPKATLATRLKPLREAIGELAARRDKLDFSAVQAGLVPTLPSGEGVNAETFAKALREALPGFEGISVSGQLDALRGQLGVTERDAAEVRAGSDLMAAITQARQDLDAAGNKLPIKKNQAEISALLAKVASVVGPESDTRKAINAKRTEGVTTAQRIATLRQELAGLAGRSFNPPVPDVVSAKWTGAASRLSTGLEAISDVQKLDARKAEADRLFDALGQLAGKFAPPQNDPAITSYLAAKRDAVMKPLLDGLGAGEFTDAAAADLLARATPAAKAFTDLAVTAGKLAEGWKVVANALDQGRQLNEPAAEGTPTTLGQLVGALNGDALMREPALADSFRAPRARADALAAVATKPLGDLEAMLAGGPDAASAIAVWNRLGDASLITSSAAAVPFLRANQAAARELRRDSLLQSFPERQRAARALVSPAQLQARWAAAFNRAGAADVDELIRNERLAAFAVASGADAPAGLLPHAQYNWALNNLRALLNAGSGEVNDDRARAAINAFLSAGFWSQLGPRAEAQAAKAALAAALNDQQSGAQAVGTIDWERVGPASTGEWEIKPAPPTGVLPDQLTFEMKPPRDGRWWGSRGNEPPRLTFQRLAGADGKPVYLATTVLSVDHVAQMLARGDWQAFRKLYTADPNGQTFLDENFRVAATWSPIAGGPGIAFGVPDPGVGGVNWWRGQKREMLGQRWTAAGSPPAPGHPFTRVPPVGALQLAFTFKCRVPTPEEYRAALAANNQSAVAAPANFRDQKFKAARDELLATARRQMDARVDPLQWGAAQPVPEQLSSASYADFDDGAALFRTVDDDPASGGPFKHLLGNVWQITHASRDEMDDAVRKATPVASQMFDANAPRGERLRLVGGSCMSPPTLGFDQLAAGLPLSTRVGPTTLDRQGQAAGFLDAGVRLAFTAPEPPKMNVTVTAVPLAKRLADASLRAAFLAPPAN